MSQQVLADLAGVTQGYLSQIEAGKRSLERRSTQVSIANALNISVARRG
jgi:transcriptional regulator with XRE-family HTH domain